MNDERFDVGAATHIAQRDTNEDRAGAGVFAGGGYLIVADGVGGEPWGDEASETVCHWVRASLEKQVTLAWADQAPLELMIKRAFRCAFFGLRAGALQKRRSFGMKTTLILAMVRNDELAIGHLGDGSAWAMAPTQHQAESLVLPMANGAGELTGLLSPWRSQDPHILKRSWEPGSVLFITTDGVSDPVSQDGFTVLGEQLRASSSAVQVVLEQLLDACHQQHDSDGPIFQDNMGIAALRHTLGDHID